MPDRLISVVVPIGVFVFLLVAEHRFPHLFPGLTSSELGLVESLQALILLGTLCVAGALILRRDLACPLWVKAWIGAAMVGLLYTLLEEISYGQHYLNWSTPEYWKKLNDQNETNFHNVSSWLDQKPRALLEVGVVVGGIVVPLLRRFKPSLLPDRLRLILPHSAVLVTALLAMLPRIYARIVAAVASDEWNLFARTREVQELYFYYFALLYFLYLGQALLADKRQ